MNGSMSWFQIERACSITGPHAGRLGSPGQRLSGVLRNLKTSQPDRPFAMVAFYVIPANGPGTPKEPEEQRTHAKRKIIPAKGLHQTQLQHSASVVYRKKVTDSDRLGILTGAHFMNMPAVRRAFLQH